MEKTRREENTEATRRALLDAAAAGTGVVDSHRGLVLDGIAVSVDERNP
jgi:hypothetical protein